MQPIEGLGILLRDITSEPSSWKWALGGDPTCSVCIFEVAVYYGAQLRLHLEPSKSFIAPTDITMVVLALVDRELRCFAPPAGAVSDLFRRGTADWYLPLGNQKAEQVTAVWMYKAAGIPQTPMSMPAVMA